MMTSWDRKGFPHCWPFLRAINAPVLYIVVLRIVYQKKQVILFVITHIMIDTPTYKVITSFRPKWWYKIIDNYRKTKEDISYSLIADGLVHYVRTHFRGANMRFHVDSAWFCAMSHQTGTWILNSVRGPMSLRVFLLQFKFDGISV